MSNRAWVTLATNDSYGLGALVLAHSLRRAESVYPAVVLITPSVSEAMRERLRAVFVEVIIVDVLDSRDAAHLALLSRPELGITFTKIHCWGLTQFEKCVFLDADTLVVQNCDELFEREELSAAPDVGWPDCFNSGVFVYKPSKETFEALLRFSTQHGSFDGGDQGLLNSFFSDWAHGDISKHLPFLYNVTSAAFYSYLPALKHFGQNLKIIHFIGNAKPWLQPFNWETRNVDGPGHLLGTMQLWWDIFVLSVHPHLDTAMVEVDPPPELPPQDLMSHYEPFTDPNSEFPWHRPELQAEQNEEENIDMTQFHDPWNYYRGNVPPMENHDDTVDDNPTRRVEITPDLRNFAWEYNHQQQQVHTDTNTHKTKHQEHVQGNTNHSNFQNSSSFYQDNTNHNLEYSHTNHYHEHYHNEHNSHTHFNIQLENGCNGTEEHGKWRQRNEHEHTSPRNSVCTGNILDGLRLDIQDQMLDSNSEEVNETNKNQIIKDFVKDCSDSDRGTDDNDDESVIPRHPYDDFYLKHKVTINAHGRKICTHELPLSPPPGLRKRDSESSSELQSGVAGNLARITPGSYGSQREAVDELTRRQGWEAGNIDYMGADSFDNIWAKISQTLAQTRTSPPKETTPPLKQQTPPPSLAKEPGPPTKQPSPQPKQPSPPTKQPTPPPKQSTPPPKQSTHPPKQRTPPPKQASPPPEQSTPPPKQPTPPPKQASSPPEQSTPTPKQPSPAKDTQSVQIVPAAQQEQPKEAPAVPQEQQKEGPADPIDTKKSTEPTQVQAVEPDVTKITAPISTASVATVSDIPVVIPEATVTALESGAPVESTVLPVDTVTSDIPLEPSPSESATKPETVADEPKIEEPSKDAKPDSISPVAPVAPVEKTEVESPQDIKPTEVSKTAKTESDTKVDETKSEAEALTQKPSEAAISEPKASVAAPVTPEKSLDLTISSTDSPPLANTPAKEEPQPLPAAAPKTTEEAAQETRL